MADDEDQHDHWGPEEYEPGERRRSRSTRSTDSRSAVVAAVVAAVLLLAVVAFVAVRSASDNNKGKRTIDSSTVADSGTSPSTVTVPTTAARPHVDWPMVLDFPPKLFYRSGYSAPDPQPGAESRPGVYLWEGFDGWQLRIVPGARVGHISGRVTGAEGTAITQVTGASPGVARTDGTDVIFDVPATGSVVGVSFQLGFYTQMTQISIYGPNGPLDPSLIFLGQQATPAQTSPMTFQKVPR